MRIGNTPLTQWDHRHITVISIEIRLPIQQRSLFSIRGAPSLLASDCQPALIFNPCNRGPGRRSMHSVMFLSCLCAFSRRCWQGSSKPKATCSARDQGVSKALAPDTLGVPAVDQPMAVLMLTLKAEQAAIKTLKFSGVELERLPAAILKSLQEHAHTLCLSHLSHLLQAFSLHLHTHSHCSTLCLTVLLNI